MRLNLRLLTTACSFILSLFCSSFAFGQATLVSDKDDYPPGSIVTLTGSGFTPNETVTLMVVHVGNDPDGTDPEYHEPWIVTADENGNFVTTWEVPVDGDAEGATLLATADGQTSGLHAEATFTDASFQSISITSPSPISYGTGGFLDYTVTANMAGNSTSINITLSVSGLPVTVTPIWFDQTGTVQQAPPGTTSFTFPATNANKIFILRLLVQNNTDVPTSTFTVTGVPSAGQTRTNTASLAISKVTVTPTVTVSDKQYDGNTTATILTRTLTGVLNGSGGGPNDVGLVTLSGGAATFTSKNVGVPAAPQTVNIIGLSITGTKAGNYALSNTSTTTTASITSKPLTAIFTIDNKVYDGTTTATITDRQLSGAVSGEDGQNKLNFTGGVANFADKNVGPAKTVTITGTLTLGGSSVSGASANNYAITTITSGTAAITFRTATIVFTVSDKTYDGTTVATITAASVPSATIDPLHGLIAGDNVTVDFSSAIATFNSKDVSITQPQAVSANGFILAGPDGPAPGGNGNYQVNSITVFTSAATMSQKPVTIAFTAANKVYDANTSATILTRQVVGIVSADVGPPAKVVASGGTATFANLNVGSLTVTATGFSLTGSSKDNYVIIPNSATTTASITQRPITITVTPGQNKTYGSVDPSPFAYTYSTTINFPSLPVQGLAGTDAFSGSLTRVAGETVVSGPYVINQGTLVIKNGIIDVSSNYAITYSGANFAIKPLAVSVTAITNSKTYGSLDPALTYTSNPAVGSLLANGDAISFAGSLSRAPGETVPGSPYAINQGTVANGNYTITYSGANFSIDPLGVTVTATAKSKTYGALDPALTFTSNPALGSLLANGDAISFSGSLTRAPGETVSGGPYAINQGTVSNNNYTITYTGANFTINPLGVTVTATANSKTYGALDPALTFTSNPALGSLLANGDAISFTGLLTRTPGETVAGGPYAINQGTVANDNYTITFTGANFTINPLGVTVTAATKNKTYGSLDPALTFTSNPALGSLLANGDAINFTGLLTRAPGETVPGSPYSINQGTVANSNYTITYVGANFTIDPLGVTVTAVPNNKTYGSLDPAFTYTSNPTVGSLLPNGDAISFSGSLARAPGETVPGSPYAINQGSVANSNYTITYVGANFTINPLGVTVTAVAKSKTYGTLDPALTFTSNPTLGSLLANGDAISFTGTLTRAPGETVPGSPYAINQGSVANANYTITYTGANFTINPLGVTVTAVAKNKTYGALDPALTFSSNPAVGSLLANGDAISFTGSLTRAPGETVLGSPYAINQGTVTNSNYTITYVGANFAINPLGVTVTAAAKSKTYGALDPSLTFSSNPAVGSLLANGDAISFTGSLTRAPGETVPGSPYAINQGTIANSNYTITYTGANLTINPLGVTVTAAAKSKTYGALDPALTFTSNPAVGSLLANGDAISFTGSLTRAPGETVPGSPYAINQGTIANSNYTITYTGANLTINPLGVSVTAAAKSKTYGALDPALTFTSNPAVGSLLANGDAISFTGSLTRAPGETVLGSPYAINQGTLANSNYTITYTGANLTINPLGVTVTAAAKSKTYGASDPPLTFTSNPAVGSLMPNGDAISFTGSLTRVPGETVPGSPYAINQGTVANSNYTITYVGANLTITPAIVATSVTATPNPQQYSDTVRLCAKITGGAPLLPGGPQAAQTVTFKIGTQVIATNVPLVVSGADLKATYTTALLEPTPFGTAPTGQMAPGVHTVTATITGADPNFSLGSSAPTVPLNINKEDAKITYTGLTLVATTGTATTATVTLSATIQDITAVTGDPFYDTYPGDIRNATITFNVDGIDKATVPIGLVNSADTKTGTAVYNLTGVGLGDHTVVLKLNGYYAPATSGDNQFVVEVYQASGDFITGGGYLKLTSSSNGTKPGDAGTKNNYGFNVKYNKGGTNLQGTINTIFRRMEGGVLHVYQVKGNSLTSLSVDPNVTTSHPYPTAVFNGKANVTDITNPLSTVSVGGNYTLQVSMTDAGEPGTSDKIGIIVYSNGGGVFYCSNWNGTSTVQQTIGGGNLVVHGASTSTSGTNAITLVSPTRQTLGPVTNGEPSVLSDRFAVKVLENPVSDYFTLKVQSNILDAVVINIYDITGRQVGMARGSIGESIKVGNGLVAGTYYLSVRQGKNSSTIKVLKF